MAQTSKDRRTELEQEYLTWAQLCLDKHGLPYPIQQEKLGESSDQDLSTELKKLKVLGRTPHE